MAARGPTALATSFAPCANDNRPTAKISGTLKQPATSLRVFPSTAARRTTSGLATANPNTKNVPPNAKTVATSGFHKRLNPLLTMYMANTPAISATRTGTHRFAAPIRSSRKIISHFTSPSSVAAITPPDSGEMTQLAAILPITAQFTASTPAAIEALPITAPTMECVVDTGAPR